MARIWIVNPFDPLPGDPEPPGRYASLATLLSRAGHEVTWWTASFSHRYKRPLDQSPLKAACAQRGIIARFIDTPGYQRNVGFQRIRSHRAYARRFEREAGLSDAADVIIASNPPLESAAAAARVARRISARLIIDVQDIWIDNFRRFLPGVVRWMWPMLLSPWCRNNREAFAAADAVVGVAGRYADEPRRYGRQDYLRLVVPLGVDVALFDKAAKAGRRLLDAKPEGELWIIYSGSLSRNYDVLTVTAAATRLVQEHPHVRFIINGRGELETEVKAIIGDTPRVEFLQFAPFEDWAATVTQCDIGMNAVRPESLIQMPNKVFYYWAAGLAVMNSVPGECADHVESTQTGLTYQAGNVEDACRVLNDLIADRGKLAAMKANARQYAERRWDRRVLYEPYVELVDHFTEHISPPT